MLRTIFSLSNVINLTSITVTLVAIGQAYLQSQGARNSTGTVVERLTESFTLPSTLHYCFVWTVFLTVYGILYLYEKENSPPRQRELHEKNHHLNLWGIGLSAAIVHQTTYAFDAVYPVAHGPLSLVLYVLSACLTIYGFFWLAWGRVSINGYWVPDIYIWDDMHIKTQGAYAVMRHPIYTGQIAIVVAIFLACNNWWLIHAPLLAALQGVRRALVEERALNGLMPREYESYRAQVKRFIGI
jgi:protein-S-isoprenylcysteine O-methyltransferase Ste14